MPRMSFFKKILILKIIPELIISELLFIFLVLYLFNWMILHEVESNIAGVTLNGDEVVWITIDFLVVSEKYKYTKSL